MSNPRFLFIFDNVNSFMDDEFFEKFSTYRKEFESPVLEGIGETYILLDYSKFTSNEMAIICKILSEGPTPISYFSSEEIENTISKLIEEGLLAQFDATEDYEFGYGEQLEAVCKERYSILKEECDIIAFNFS